MTKIKLIIISALFLMGAAGCSESFLDQEPENVIPESMIYEDKELVLSVLSNLYGRVNWGQNNGDYGSYDQFTLPYKFESTDNTSSLSS